ncbi:hypothetical protein P7C70_g6755, partial [Phenoliferia sp. Uapishka_3]
MSEPCADVYFHQKHKDLVEKQQNTSDELAVALRDLGAVREKLRATEIQASTWEGMYNATLLPGARPNTSSFYGGSNDIKPDIKPDLTERDREECNRMAAQYRSKLDAATTESGPVDREDWFTADALKLIRAHRCFEKFIPTPRPIDHPVNDKYTPPKDTTSVWTHLRLEDGSQVEENSSTYHALRGTVRDICRDLYVPGLSRTRQPHRELAAEYLEFQHFEVRGCALKGRHGWIAEAFLASYWSNCITAFRSRENKEGSVADGKPRVARSRKNDNSRSGNLAKFQFETNEWMDAGYLDSDLTVRWDPADPIPTSDSVFSDITTTVANTVTSSSQGWSEAAEAAHSETPDHEDLPPPTQPAPIDTPTGPRQSEAKGKQAATARPAPSALLPAPRQAESTTAPAFSVGFGFGFDAQVPVSSITPAPKSASWVPPIGTKVPAITTVGEEEAQEHQQEEEDGPTPVREFKKTPGRPRNKTKNAEPLEKEAPPKRHKAETTQKAQPSEKAKKNASSTTAPRPTRGNKTKNPLAFYLAKTVPELKELAQEQKVSSSGKKDELAARLWMAQV